MVFPATDNGLVIANLQWIKIFVKFNFKLIYVLEVGFDLEHKVST